MLWCSGDPTAASAAREEPAVKPNNANATNPPGIGPLLKPKSRFLMRSDQGERTQ
jgi:hypothetical protein